MEINCFSAGQYRSIEQCHRDNGDRHARKAEYWRSQGKPEYAEGSMRKARRNWARADAWKTPEWAVPLVREMVDRISQKLYTTGTGSSPFSELFDGDCS